MGVSRFDILQLYRLAWSTMPYVVPAEETVNQPSTDNPYKIEQAPAKTTVGAYGSPFYGVDVMGREYYCPVKLNDIDMDYPTIRIQGEANIVSTKMVERKGEVHEIVSIDDYSITIRGLIINHTGNELDDSRIHEYYDVFEQGQQVTLRSVITDRALHPDYKAIIKKLGSPEFFGVKNVYRYEIDLISDFIFELIVT